MSEGRSAVVARDLPSADTAGAGASGSTAEGRVARAARNPKVRWASRGFGKRLRAVKRVAEELPVTGGDWSYAAPAVNPDLMVWVSPQVGEDVCPSLGLVSSSKFGRPVRHGLKGITNAGKKQIRSASKLLEDVRSRLFFITINLPDADYIDLMASGKWPIFQSETRSLIARLLKDAGDEAVVIGVCEIGPKRLATTGLACPHLHILCTGRGRKSPDGGWLITKHVIDDLVAKAAEKAGLPPRDRSPGRQLSDVKWSVGSYMSKYLTKAQAVDPLSLPEDQHNLIPHQWWNQSEACKALVDGHLFRLPPAFSAFLMRQRALLERLNLGHMGSRQMGERTTISRVIPIELFYFRFRSPESLHQAIELFCLWVTQGEPDGLEWVDLSG